MQMVPDSVKLLSRWYSRRDEYLLLSMVVWNVVDGGRWNCCKQSRSGSFTVLFQLRAAVSVVETRWFADACNTLPCAIYHPLSPTPCQFTFFPCMYHKVRKPLHWVASLHWHFMFNNEPWIWNERHSQITTWLSVSFFYSYLPAVISAANIFKCKIKWSKSVLSTSALLLAVHHFALSKLTIFILACVGRVKHTCETLQGDT